MVLRVGLGPYSDLAMSTSRMSWSLLPIGGSVLQRSMLLGCVVNNMSRMLLPLVG